MLDAVGRLVKDGTVCCSFSNIIVGKHRSNASGQTDGADADGGVDDNLDDDELNPNQVRAVESSENPLALIWGPPGAAGILLHVNLGLSWPSFRNRENHGGRKNSSKALQDSG